MPAPSRRTSAKPVAKTDAPSTQDSGGLASLLAGVTVAAAPPKRKASSKPILTLEHVRESLSTGEPYSYPPMDAALVETVKSDLQRAASQLKCGVSKSAEDQGNGTFVLTFQATANKRKRAYSSADIRQWAYDNKGIDIRADKGKIPDDIRLAFKIAKGLVKVTPDNATATDQD